MKVKHIIGSIVIVGIVLIVGVNQLGNKDKGGEDDELVEWASAMNEVLSETMDDLILKEANNEEGYVHYLKAIEVHESFPRYSDNIEQELVQHHLELYMAYNKLTHDQWNPTDDEIREAFEKNEEDRE